MSTVFLDSTSCCEVAICDDQANCPVCKQEVLPRSRNERWNRAYGRAKLGHYGNPRPNDKREEPALSKWKERLA